MHEPIVEFVGAGLGLIALIIAIYAFKRTLDFEAYGELDSNYMEILKLGLKDPDLRDSDKTNNFKELETEKKLKYETYAYLVWNLCETIYDREKIDKTWLPVIEEEKRLHFEWLKENPNKFKDEFIKFIEQKKIPYKIGMFPG